MKRFSYWQDPVCLGGCLLYAVNRWWLKPHFKSAFLHNSFNDLLLIPCALPVLLWLERRLGLRTHDQVPTWNEVLRNLITWSILFEGIGPHLMPWTVGDPWDVVAYFVGGILAALWWRPPTLLARNFAQ
jgi:hypothetical protein